MRFSTVASVFYGAAAYAQANELPTATLLTTTMASPMEFQVVDQPRANPSVGISYARQLYEHAKVLISRAKKLVRDNPNFGPSFTPQPLLVPAGFEPTNLIDQFNRLVYYIGACNSAQYTLNRRSTPKQERGDYDFVRGSPDYVSCVDEEVFKWLEKFDDFVTEEALRLTAWVSENPQFTGSARASTLANSNLLPPGWTRALLDMSPATHRILVDLRDFVRQLLNQPNLSPDLFLENYVSTSMPSPANGRAWPAGVSFPIEELYGEVVGFAMTCSSPSRRNLNYLFYDSSLGLYDLDRDVDRGVEQCISFEIQDFISPGSDLQKWGAKHMQQWFEEYQARVPTASVGASTTPAWNPFASYPAQFSGTGYRYSVPYLG